MSSRIVGIGDLYTDGLGSGVLQAQIALLQKG
jgi:hypothetical protein